MGIVEEEGKRRRTGEEGRRSKGSPIREKIWSLKKGSVDTEGKKKNGKRKEKKGRQRSLPPGE